MIEDIIRRMRRNWPHLADDLEQEIRVAAWRAEEVSTCVPYVRQRARGAALDMLRSYHKTRDGKPAPVFNDCDPDEIAVETPDPEHALEMTTDLAILRAVVLTDQATVARAFGCSAPSMCKRMKRVRRRLEANLTAVETQARSLFG